MIYKVHTPLERLARWQRCLRLVRALPCAQHADAVHAFSSVRCSPIVSTSRLVLYDQGSKDQGQSGCLTLECRRILCGSCAPNSDHLGLLRTLELGSATSLRTGAQCSSAPGGTRDEAVLSVVLSAPVTAAKAAPVAGGSRLLDQAVLHALRGRSGGRSSGGGDCRSFNLARLEAFGAAAVS